MNPLLLTITPKIIAQFEEATSLTFIKDNVSEGNVCYADNPDLRPDYKTTFRKIDVENCILGLTQSQKNGDLIVPKDAETFWEIVDLGKSHP